jgi:hypothetical protein
MKLGKDPILVNMSMVELNGKKVLVRPSQSESTKGKEVIIGEEQPPRMINPKSLNDGQWQKNEGSKLQQCSKATFDILMAKYKEGRASIRGQENWTIRNTKSVSPVSLSRAPLQPGAHLTNDLRPRHDQIQKVRIVNSKIIIRCLTF